MFFDSKTFSFDALNSSERQELISLGNCVIDDSDLCFPLGGLKRESMIDKS